MTLSRFSNQALEAIRRRIKDRMPENHLGVAAWKYWHVMYRVECKLALELNKREGQRMGWL
jgi:hypothetical protein